MRRAAIVIAALLLGAAAPADPALNARVFDRACDIVARRYWDVTRLADWPSLCARYRPRAVTATSQGALYRLLGEMLGRVGDSHVFAVDPVARRFAERTGGDDIGEFGFSTEWRDGGWRVFSVDRSGPAARAGVEIGWQLVAVNDAGPDPDYHPRPGERAVLRFRDEEGRDHLLTLAGVVLADPAPRRAERLADGVLLVTLDAFERGVGTWLRDAIEAAQPRAVVLDLRENYGGEAMAVAQAAGAFFADRRTLLIRQGRGKAIDVPLIRGGARAWTGPLAVLVGPRSASGAEVTAALVAESRRGITVGQHTAGALTGAALYDLPDGGQLSVAVFDIRTPGGKRLERLGFTPEIVVVPQLAELRAGRDPVLAAAILALPSVRAETQVDEFTGYSRSSARH